MKIARAACQALGLAVVYLLLYIYPLIEPSHSFIYHLNVSPSLFFVPVLIDIAALSAIFTALILFVLHRPGRFGFAIVSGLLLFIPEVLIRAVYVANNVPQHKWALICQIIVSIFMWIVVNLFVSPGSRLFDKSLHFASTLFLFLGVSGIVVVVELLFCFHAARNIERPLALHQESSFALGRTQGRIIWIVLDELSYRQVYERRFPGLQLPAFDQLASESAVFTDITPAGDRTDKILPSLIGGTQASAVQASADGLRLSLRDAATLRWSRFDPANTVFADAVAAHYSTAVVGWAIPYCRILPAMLDHCYWSWTGSRIEDMSGDQTIARNSLAPLIALGADLRKLFRSGRDQQNVLSEVDDRADYDKLILAADRALEDPSETFLMLHMPFPHPGAYYSRRTGSFITHGGSYIDGLALADKFIAHVRETLAGRGEWNLDTVIVMGDHSWRTTLIWRGARGWTAEDEAASLGGRFDPRPAYIVKLPGEVRGVHIDAPMNAMRTRALMDQLMQRRIGSTDELAAWAK